MHTIQKDGGFIPMHLMEVISHIAFNILNNCTKVLNMSSTTLMLHTCRDLQRWSVAYCSMQTLDTAVFTRTVNLFLGAI